MSCKKSTGFRTILKVAFCFNFNGKIGTIKANTRHICSALHMQKSVSPSVGHLLGVSGEYASSLRHSLNQVEAWVIQS